MLSVRYVFLSCIQKMHVTKKKRTKIIFYNAQSDGERYRSFIFAVFSKQMFLDVAPVNTLNVSASKKL